MPGKLIVIEGPDACGKSTICEELLLRRGEFAFFSFPDYSTPTGEVIRHYLLGSMDPEPIQLVYAANRLEKKGEIEEALNNNKDVLCCRYSLSNLAFGLASGFDPSWLYALDREMPIPDLTIVILPPERLHRYWVERRRRKVNMRDINEVWEFQVRVREEYKELPSIFYEDEIGPIRFITGDESSFPQIPVLVDLIDNMIGEVLNGNS